MHNGHLSDRPPFMPPNVTPSTSMKAGVLTLRNDKSPYRAMLCVMEGSKMITYATVFL